METTMFLASLWGPVMIAAGIGFFSSPKYYEKIYRDLEKSPFAILIFGMAAMAAGLAQIHAHNLWGTLSEGLVSLLGWGLFLKGVAATAFPNTVDEMGNWWAKKKMTAFVGYARFLLGFYLSFIGYFG
jgi:uncharacterized protein YjeT (DUF2065 family)